MNSENTPQENGLNPNFDLSGFNPTEFLEETAELEKKAEEASQRKGIFRIKPINQWLMDASKRPIPNMLFGELWFEGELCILYADTNVGKSILAVQIGDAISQGTSIKGFEIEADSQKVLYFDFELSDKQLEGRYSKEYTNHYPFSSNLLRVELDQECLDLESH